MGPKHYGEERARAPEARTEQIIAEESAGGVRFRTSRLDGHKGDPAKVAWAARWRAETTLTAGWIAEHVELGIRDHLNHLLYGVKDAAGKQP